MSFAPFIINVQDFNTAAVAADPQLQFFENFPLKGGQQLQIYSNGTVSVHAVNIPLSLSFNYPVVLASMSTAGSMTLQFGLYTKNDATLSLLNSASRAVTAAAGLSWLSMATSTTQNITPGGYYFAFNVLSSGASSISFLGNNSYGLPNNPPVVVKGRMTVSTNAMPGSIATSDITAVNPGANRHPYIIITA